MNEQPTSQANAPCPNCGSAPILSFGSIREFTCEPFGVVYREPIPESIASACGCAAARSHVTTEGVPLHLATPDQRVRVRAFYASANASEIGSAEGRSHIQSILVAINDM